MDSDERRILKRLQAGEISAKQAQLTTPEHREALTELGERGVVNRTANGGYVVARKLPLLTRLRLLGL